MKWLHCQLSQEKLLSDRTWHFADQCERNFGAQRAGVTVPGLTGLFHAPLPLHWYCWLKNCWNFPLKRDDWFFNTLMKLCESVPRLLDWWDGFFPETLHFGGDLSPYPKRDQLFPNPCCLFFSPVIAAASRKPFAFTLLRLFFPQNQIFQAFSVNIITVLFGEHQEHQQAPKIQILWQDLQCHPLTEILLLLPRFLTYEKTCYEHFFLRFKGVKLFW